ncbi:MAG: hypothetical protein HOE62_14230 [Alphaproteobacteria bacterium]|jgi:hypothetical protein|nr:hypothetical protein [Alphaproteobacteria bacterium]MBT4019106.1 hypothetical protein [Alphaproteobacteria bacterium]MBT4966300.1 hypothetical protein [Alphaproteobacteria bacterium]MBT5161967.1 hypothetical protein [Alphaproteobacteria bacterium]MBT5918574.1 hypothetical protein [Alphaproteobacteria bacterium]
MRLRQFVFVAEKLEPAIEEISSVLGIEVCYRDPGVAKFGLENALFAVGGNFLEIVAPTEDGTAAGRYLERRSGDGGYMVILHCDDAVAQRNRIKSLGIRDVWSHDGPEAYATHFHPADTGGAILSIDSMASASDYHVEMASWEWAGPVWQQHVDTTTTNAIVGLELQAEDPDALAKTWSDVVDKPLALRAHAPCIGLDNAMLSFVKAKDGRGPGVGGLLLQPQNRTAIMAEANKRGQQTGDNSFMLCGMRVTLM